MNRIILIRHPVTEWNNAGKIHGHADIPLNTAGYAQATKLGKYFSTQKIDAIFASDLKRAFETAKEISRYHELSATPESSLREFHMGEYEGLTLSEIGDPELLSPSQENISDFTPPGGESVRDVVKRAESFIDIICKFFQDKTILVVSHGGVLKILLCLLLKISPTEYRKFNMNPASISEILFDLKANNVILDKLNSTNHL